MKRIRVIKKYGNTFIVPLTRIDMQDMNLQEGDLVDISQLKKEVKKNEV